MLTSAITEYFMLPVALLHFHWSFNESATGYRFTFIEMSMKVQRLPTLARAIKREEKILYETRRDNTRIAERTRDPQRRYEKITKKEDTRQNSKR